MAKQELLTRESGGPLREMMDIQRSFNRLFDEFFDWGMPSTRARRHGNGGRAWTPELDILEDDNEVLVQASMPGIEKKDISVEVRDDVLIIQAERKVPEHKGKTWFLQEMPAGTFYRAVTLPAAVDADKVKATERDGLLEIRMPKKERAKTRRISVE